jgi:hypothetical protein
MLIGQSGSGAAAGASAADLIKDSDTANFMDDVDDASQESPWR